jgi:hypothetical protein
MKNYIIIIILALLLSCTKEPNKCRYSNRTFIDSTLFVSFKINNKVQKFYQHQPFDYSGWSSISSPIIKNEDSTIYQYNYDIDFVSFTENNVPEVYISPEFMLKFSKMIVLNNKFSNSIYNPNLYNIFHDISGYSRGLSNTPKLQDTLYINGLMVSLYKPDPSININNMLSTAEVFYYYKLNKDSIHSFFKSSYSQITNIEETCNNTYLIEGTFNVKLMSSPNFKEKPDVVELTDGQFRFLRRQ